MDELNIGGTMTHLKDTITIHVEYFTGHDEGDEGTPYYVASCDDLMFTTDGETFEEMLSNVRECLLLTLQDTDSAAEYQVSPSAKVQLSYKFTQSLPS
jgi:predicted RNase H-like HicB family nuclease